MNRKYFLWIVVVSLISLFVIIILMQDNERTPVQQQAVITPLSPFKNHISGVGIVEPSSGNILIGTPVSRMIDKVLVKVGTKVKKGDILFQLEALDLYADLVVRDAAYESALANIQKLEALPRTEDLISAEASLKSAQLELEQTKEQYEMVQSLQDPRALSKEEVDRRRYNLERAEAKLQQAKADLDKIKAGTWHPDLTIARLEAVQAKANMERIKADIERTIIRSPIDGKVLQIKIHEGEFPSADASRNPIMILGNTDELYLKVSINQFDVPEFRSTAPAVAYLQGDARIEFPLEFIRLEPFLVNKQNLTNDITERVDTRVLQIIYLLKKSDQRIFVGQQMDVFIETESQQ